MRILLLLVCLLASPLLATQYALLVGVSSYASSERLTLEGPRHDIAAFRRILVERFRLNPDNILELVDRKATRASILEGLSTSVARLQANDSLLIYFSGHGTSAFDSSFRPLASLIGPNSGALVPHDFDSSTPQTIASTLIIGRRDLRPILLGANKHASIFVILDSCYSGNAAKSVGNDWEGPVRAIHLVSTTTPSSSQSGASTSRASGQFTPAGDASTATPAPADAEPDEYPYPNVVAFSAASKNEPARDINTHLIRTGRYETFDGLPHGAFTNSLLSALIGSADVNRDGRFTYGELFRFIRQDIQQFHKQTPQVQLPAEALFEKVALAAPASSAASPSAPPLPATHAATPSIRLATVGVSEADLARFAAIPGVTLTSSAHDLLVKRLDSGYSLFRSSHSLIRHYFEADFSRLAARIAAQKEVQQLESWKPHQQSFQLAIDTKTVARPSVSGAPFSSRFSVGEEFAVLLSLERAAYVLLLNVDPTGSVSILLPGPREPQPLRPQNTLEVLRARASVPAGSELLLGFAFTTKPAGWDEFACTQLPGGLSCPSFEPGSSQYSRLLQILRLPGAISASTFLRLETFDK